MDLEILKEIESEIKRFNKRLQAAKKRLLEASGAQYGCKETDALRRAALDLNMELNKFT